MDASQSNSGKEQESNGSSDEPGYSAEIERGESGALRADCGNLTVGSAGAEIMLPTSDKTTIDITGYGGESIEERLVSLLIQMGDSEPLFNQKITLTASQARDVASRLTAAARVAEMGDGDE